MRVISAQGKEVFNILRRDGVYHAEGCKARESIDYSRDIEALGGRQPIWCYAYHNVNYYTMYNGTMLDYLRQEMSLDSKNCWDNFYLFEIEIDKTLLHMGISCNNSGYSMIFSELTIDMVKAVYSIKDADVENPFYKILIPIYTASDDVITTTTLNCKEAVIKARSSTECFNQDDVKPCLMCAEDTRDVHDNKHYCSLECLWQHEQKFINMCRNVDRNIVIKFYKIYTDEDFKHGMRKVADRIIAYYSIN